MVKQAECGRTIADLTDCASLAKTITPGKKVLPGQDLWPWLSMQMEESSAAWLRFKPEHTCLAVLNLASFKGLLLFPGFAVALQAQHIISQTEFARLRSFSHGRRRAQWLGGRLATKYALQHCALPSSEPKNLPAAFSIDNDRHGKPLVKASCLTSETHISISHSGQCAVAMAASTPCGLDVQEIVVKLQRLQSRFASSVELALRSGYDELSWLAMLWAAKEAVKKCRYADQATFMERIQVEAHEGCATEPQGAVLWCRLQDEDHLVPVRLALRQGYVMAISAGARHA